MYRRLNHSVSFSLFLGFILAASVNAELVGWWKLDEGTGMTATDFSGKGNNGKLHGDPQWVTGQTGTALRLNGVDEYIEVPHSEILTVDHEVTVMAWINVERYIGPTGDNWQGILAKGESPGRSYSLYTEASGALHFSTGNPFVGTLSTPTLSLNEWTHVCAMVIDDHHQYYINGEDAGSGGSGINLPGAADTAPVVIGTAADANRELLGIIDDIRIYRRGLTQEEVQLAMKEHGQPLAFGPYPEDGAMYESTWVTLKWSAGDYAVSHDIYMGENFDDVNNGIGDTFRGNLPRGTEFYIAGFFGYPYPDGLVPGTTYYWRIDEVNETEPNSPWKGDVWSFSIPPRIAFNPYPANGSKITKTNVELSWSPGWGAKLHTVYFGDNFDRVYNATDGTPSAITIYNPGPFELGKVYYWRVDEFDGVETYRGDIWSFSTFDPNSDGGIKAEYFNGITPHGIPCLAQIESSIDHDWGNDEVACGLSDQVSARWSSGLQIDVADIYTFVTNSDDGVRVWLNGQLIIENWTDHAATIDTSQPIELEPGVYSLRMEWYDNGGNAVAQLFWETPTMERQIIPAGPLQALTVVELEDFELFTDNVNEGQAIFQTWIGGSDFGDPGTPGYVPGNGTGASVGHPEPPYAEQNIVYSGAQSMPFYYDNSKEPYYSRVDRTWDTPQDWTVEGVNALSLQVYGSSDNDPAIMYVEIEDINGFTGKVYHNDPVNALQSEKWTEWIIPLSNFSEANVNFREVVRMSIGISEPTIFLNTTNTKFMQLSGPACGGLGMALFDHFQTEKVTGMTAGVPHGRLMGYVRKFGTIDPIIDVNASVTLYFAGNLTQPVWPPTSTICGFYYTEPPQAEYVVIVSANGYFDSEPISVTVGPGVNEKHFELRPKWSTLNFNGFEGNTVMSNDEWNIKAKKNLSDGTGLLGNSDRFSYIYQELTGDGYIEAHIADISSDQSPYTSWCEAGVMIRETLDADSSYAMTTNMKGIEDGNVFQWRINSGDTTNVEVDSSTKKSWVRIERKGNELTGFLSDDGNIWAQSGNTQNINMVADVYIGVGVTVSWYDYIEKEETWTCVIDNVDVGQLP